MDRFKSPTLDRKTVPTVKGSPWNLIRPPRQQQNQPLNQNFQKETVFQRLNRDLPDKENLPPRMQNFIENDEVNTTFSYSESSIIESFEMRPQNKYHRFSNSTQGSSTNHNKVEQMPKQAFQELYKKAEMMMDTIRWQENKNMSHVESTFHHYINQLHLQPEFSLDLIEKFSIFCFHSVF